MTAEKNLLKPLGLEIVLSNGAGIESEAMADTDIVHMTKKDVAVVAQVIH